MRNRFDQQLEKLNTELINMGALCEDAMTCAVRAIFDKDEALIEKAEERERQIDQMERDVENLCMRLLLQQQPVARDLRIISSALKMISDMEHLKNMSEFAMGMLSSSINAFVEQNADKARKVILDDDVVDSYFERVKADLIESLSQCEADKEAGQFLLDILMIAKYIERVGDHATNIAEWVMYGLTGAHPEETN